MNFARIARQSATPSSEPKEAQMMEPELKQRVEAYIQANYPPDRQERLLLALNNFEEVRRDEMSNVQPGPAQA